MKKMKKACFLCSTPYHVIVASAITISENLKSDVYIIDPPIGGNVYERLNDCNVFNKVVRVKNYIKSPNNSVFNSLSMYIEVLDKYLKVERIMGDLFSDSQYDALYVYHREQNIVRMICMYLVKHNSNIDLYYYEDGIGSYYNSVIFRDYTLTQLFEYIYCGKKISLRDFSIKLFYPELYTLGFKNDKPIQNSESIKQINKIDGFDTVLSGLFSKKDNNKILEKIIFLDTVREEEFDNKGMEVFGEISELLVKKYHNDMIIKYHPRDIRCNLKEKNFSNDGIPFEYYCNYNDLNSKLIISSFSTAAFTPKILYGQEPYVVFLFNILGKGMIDGADREVLYNYLKNIYSNKEKVRAPETIDYLMDIINSFMENYVK